MKNTKLDVFKLFAKIALLVLPILIYFIIFVMFEPYNYFGVRKGDFDTNQPIYRVRDYIKNPENAILLGDSRMAHLDTNLAKQYTGKDFSNLAFGGASQKEITDLFWFAVDENENLDTVYLEVSFYTLNQKYSKDRVGNVKIISENPFAYFFNFNYNLEMLNNLRLHLINQPIDYTVQATSSYTEKDYLDENQNPLPFRSQLTKYAQTIYQNLSNYPANDIPLSDVYNVMTSKDMLSYREWQLNQLEYDRLIEVATYCKQNNIDLTFVFPPIDQSVTELCLEPLEIDTEMLLVVDGLKQTGAKVIDFEFTDKTTLQEHQFYDGFHIDTKNGLPQYTQQLFSYFS